MNKLPPPNKPPPPPPAPTSAPTPPPPLPPPKNTANYLIGSSSTGIVISNDDNRSSMNSLNSTARHNCHGQTMVSNGGVPVMPMSRFVRHGDTYNPRSSGSSHTSSLHHHHHHGIANINGNGTLVATVPSTGCPGEPPIGICGSSHQVINNTTTCGPNQHCHCPSTGCGGNILTQQHASHINSSSLGENGGCCLGQNPALQSISCDGCSCNHISHQCSGVLGSHGHQHHHHHHTSHLPIISTHSISPLQETGGGGNITSPSDQMMSPGSRIPSMPVSNGHHCGGHIHRLPTCGGCHHHLASCYCGHHAPHPNSANISQSACGCESHHSQVQQVTASSSSYISQIDGRNGGGGGSSSSYVSSPANMNHQSTHDPVLRSNVVKDHHHQANQESYTPMASTAHTHNLSNSSTTTHSSNVAMGKHHQHPPPPPPPPLPPPTASLQKDNHINPKQDNNRSNHLTTSPQQQFETRSVQHQQYGYSSAASTTSASASLSNYPLTPSSSNNNNNSSNQFNNDQQSLKLPMHLAASKMNQPLPPPPPPPLSPLPLSSKSRPHSPASIRSSQSMFMTNRIMYTGNNGSDTNTCNYPMSSSQSAHQINHQRTPVPPLPPKPLSPSPVANYPQQQYLSSSSISSCPTQITTVSRTSPGLQNAQPITRLTSQAGVENPLPASDIPPPLPPVGMRPQRLLTMAKLHQQQALQGYEFNQMPNHSTNATRNATTTNPIPNFVNLSIGSGNKRGNGASLDTSGISEAERKTEALARQVELEIDQQRNSANSQLVPHGLCAKCLQKVLPSQEACKAMNQIFHAACFVCCECGRTLSDKTFYPVGDKVYCEEDFKYTGHMQSLKNCAACLQPIFDMILPAMGKSYHPKCFRCSICNQCLDGVPFTIDRKNKIYCVKDYHSIYSPKCAACGKSISPIDGTDETVRVVSMEKDYHVDCYCCEDCGLQLTDEKPSQSYPLDGHLLCQPCHINRRSKTQSMLSLN